MGFQLLFLFIAASSFIYLLSYLVNYFYFVTLIFLLTEYFSDTVNDIKVQKWLVTKIVMPIFVLSFLFFDLLLVLIFKMMFINLVQEVLWVYFICFSKRQNRLIKWLVNNHRCLSKFEIFGNEIRDFKRNIFGCLSIFLT